MNYKTILEQIKEKELKEVDELSYDDKKYIKSDYEFLSVTGLLHRNAAVP